MSKKDNDPFNDAILQEWKMFEVNNVYSWVSKPYNTEVIPNPSNSL